MVKIRITTHSGSDEILEVESYNAEQITELRNSENVQAIQLGVNSYSKIDLKNITVEE